MSIITLLLIAVILFFSRHELEQAFGLLSTVNPLVFLIVLPIIAIAYLASGEMVFAYLREKKTLKHVNLLTQMRISLELNFVNHILPSGGVSGISYVNWRLGKFGVTSGKATMAQAVRYVVGFAGMVTLLILSVVLVTMDGTVNRWIILMSSALVTTMLLVTIGFVYLMKSVTRIRKFSHLLARVANATVKKMTFGRVKHIVYANAIEAFLDEMHEDFIAINKDRRVLLKPYLWGLFFTIAEISVFWIVFWALGSPINPAPILIAYGLASLAGFIVITPGGAGAYEAIMVAVLAFAGMPKGEAIAGIVMTRAMILFVTIVIGYIFYQQALVRYGKRPKRTL